MLIMLSSFVTSSSLTLWASVTLIYPLKLIEPDMLSYKLLIIWDRERGGGGGGISIKGGWTESIMKRLKIRLSFYATSPLPVLDCPPWILNHILYYLHQFLNVDSTRIILLKIHGRPCWRSQYISAWVKPLPLLYIYLYMSLFVSCVFYFVLENNWGGRIYIWVGGGEGGNTSFYQGVNIVNLLNQRHTTLATEIIWCCFGWIYV